jgi:hypothetical protein
MYDSTDRPEIRKKVASYFTPSLDEKKKNGEVSTPVELVNDMLGRVPCDFWTTPKKVFEPCCGKGNFILGIFEMFFKGLENTIPDEEERCRVIIEECIYFSDIEEINVFICSELLRFHSNSSDKTYKFNDCVGDTLQLNIEEKWGLKGFDLVVGNPPYNLPYGIGTGHLLWHLFTREALKSWTKENGYLCFVHPALWRKPQGVKARCRGFLDLMTKENKMIYLEIHNHREGTKLFGAGTRYDWYLIQKTKPEVGYRIEVKAEGGAVEYLQVHNWEFIPNNNFRLVEKLLAKEGEETVSILPASSLFDNRRKHMSEIQSEEDCFPLVHSTGKRECRMLYTNTKDGGGFNIPKIIFGRTGLYRVVIDTDGTYGVTGNAIALLTDDPREAKEMSDFLLNPKFTELIHKTFSWSNFVIDRELFSYFKKYFYKQEIFNLYDINEV